MIRLAQSGENGLLWNAIAVAGGVASARRREDYVRAIEIVLLTLAVNTVIKYTVRRARPVRRQGGQRAAGHADALISAPLRIG